MRRYETIVIIDPDISDDDRGSLITRIQEIMVQKNGALLELDDWGVKRLAYEIRKKIRGYYVRFDYCGMGDLVDEIERFFRINDKFLKYMTIVLNKDADIDKIREEIAAEKNKPAESTLTDADTDMMDSSDEDGELDNMTEEEEDEE
ncbi:MAG: 30S ribosomal protein S6 [Desulfatirhabdiaceae bacterium]